jgi:DNA-binding GntR family transcriptional regulator
MPATPGELFAPVLPAAAPDAAVPPQARSRIEDTPLKQHAYTELKNRILTGVYPPGGFLSERRLVEQLGMSKTPIRSALERLEAEGFVAVSPRQGIIVREPSMQEIGDQFAIRFALERYVLEALAGRLTEEQVRRVQENLKAQRQAVERSDLAASIRLDGEFHALFCEFLGNQEILRVMCHLRERMMVVIGLVFQKNPERMAPNYQEHQAIAQAVLDGKAEKAVDGLKRHLEYGKQRLLSRP